MGGGSFPVDLILFAMIAAFLVLRLRSILGRRTGFERPAAPVVAAPVQPPIIEARAEPPSGPHTAHILPDPASEAGQALLEMRRAGDFDPERFLAGAGQAFGIIVAAFAAGDRERLKLLLSAEMFTAFCDAINGRMERGETQRSELREISELRIVGAALRGSVAEVTVRIVSDQISMIEDAAHNPISGTDAVTELTDLWTFERDLKSPDPTWRLSGARSA
jgi:predicted lipid-binding transport protein (Tim44 family)